MKIVLQLTLLFGLLFQSMTLAKDSILTALHQKKQEQLLLNHIEPSFEENKGQITGEDANRVKFSYQKQGFSMFLLDSGIAYQFTNIHFPKGYKHLDKGATIEDINKMNILSKNIQIETFRIDVNLLGANPNAKVTTHGEKEDYVNYYNNNILNVHQYQKIIYHDIYPNIDWVFYQKNGHLKYDFIVHPGGNPEQIRLKANSTTSNNVNKDGSLTFHTPMGQITEQTPVSYQKGQEVITKFKITKEVIQFDVSNYKKDETIRIDPTLEWATYYGGTGSDFCSGLSTDNNGNVYLGGFTFSTSNIASVGYQNTLGGNYDAILVKFNSFGVRQWATYYGGTESDKCTAVSVDSIGNVFLGGFTYSTSNVASGGGHQNTFGGNSDAFLVKFNPSGVRLWATYYGGTGHDDGYALSADNYGNIYISGLTWSHSNIASGGHQNTKGGQVDAFLVKFNSSGVRQWATYYGEIGHDYGRALATDGNGNVYMGGSTSSITNISSGGHQNTFGGNSDAFLVKFNSSGVRQWATYYGGNYSEDGFALTTDNSGYIYIGGCTNSITNIASGGHQNTLESSTNAFLVKFNSSGVRQWATYYGGSSFNICHALSTDRSYNVYLGGQVKTYSYLASDIASEGYQNTYGGGNYDSFLAKFDSSGVRLWGSYYGGITEDKGFALAIDSSENVYLGGNTTSTSNIASGGHQNTYGGGYSDCFLVKFDTCNVQLTTDTIIACDSIIWIDGNTYTASNNTASHTLTNIFGCDSVIALNLIISQTSFIDIQTSCDSLIWIDGNTYTTSNNMATHTLTNTAGCDSIITLNLTIQLPSSGTDVQTVCDSLIWIDGNTYTTSNNTATHTLTNTAGCDSVITLNLTINNANSGIDTITTCNTYTWIDGNTYVTSNNTATHTLTNTAGCDSVVTLNLTIHNTNVSINTVTTCDSYTWIDGNTYTTSNYTATHILTNTAGCDSVVTLNLTINNANSGIDTITTCDNYTWIDGNTYVTSNNTATHTLTNTAGCDSMVTLNLTINTVSDITSSLNGQTITSTNTNALYQWLDCDNGNTIIPMETNQTFTASSNGNYAVELTENGCVDTSYCVLIETVSIGENNFRDKLVVHPNPTTGKFFIDLGKKHSKIKVKMTDINGRLIQSSENKNTQVLNLNITGDLGIYFLIIELEEQKTIIKLIKQ